MVPAFGHGFFIVFPQSRCGFWEGKRVLPPDADADADAVAVAGPFPRHGGRRRPAEFFQSPDSEARLTGAVPARARW